MRDKISLVSDIEKIDKILTKFSGGKKPQPRPMKPKIKIIFIYSKKNDKINGYLYAYDLSDGYFRECILDDLDTGSKFDIIIAKKLIKRLIAYCKKQGIDIFAVLGKYGYGKAETELYRKIGFRIIKENKVANYFV